MEGLELELRAPCLLGRRSTIWAMLPAQSGFLIDFVLVFVVLAIELGVLYWARDLTLSYILLTLLDFLVVENLDISHKD